MSNIFVAILAVALIIWGVYRAISNSKIAKANLAKAEQFLKTNAAKEGVVSTESGLQYQVVKQGDGVQTPSLSNKVTVHYHGSLIDGSVFDSSVQRGEAITFGLNQVIKGWTEGLQLMHVGDKYRFFIHPKLAYGARKIAAIPGNSALVFDVELIAID